MAWQQQANKKIRWVLVPCPYDARVIRDLTLTNSGARVSSQRRSINEYVAKGRTFYEYVFYAPEMQVPLFCTYDDGTCERFEHPYMGFPLVRTTALPTHVLFGMYWKALLINSMQCMRYAREHLDLVDRIYWVWSKPFPHKFYWGPARKSFLHPRSVDSYCLPDDGDRCESCKSSRCCALDDADSSTCCHVTPSAFDSCSGATDDVVETIDVVRIDTWRRQVADHDLIRMPDLEPPPSHIAHATSLTTRTLNYRPTPECHVGWSSDIDTSRYTSNDWAFHKLGTSLWVVGGSTRKQDQKKLRATKRACRRPAKSMALASRRAAVAPVLPNERASDVCASPERRDSTDRVDCRVTSGLAVDDIAISRNVKHLLDRKIAPPRIRRSHVQVASASRKRQRDIEDITRIEPPRKRANCHW
ncbi:hypothetical protein FISHEDRAFT_78794 [Fistulina hepatica ATCC 64428]|uniref:Uncharacterized protein n=1 Tax=Fistulina hepatica ATCC 64428 TaxID=1128425 RepID=A0A0D7A040_9AGAR|nr:hypothetical protein FISHEDRAFT_78794 [Fistulina hepatica ATCC 64428]